MLLHTATPHPFGVALRYVLLVWTILLLRAGEGDIEDFDVAFHQVQAIAVAARAAIRERDGRCEAIAHDVGRLFDVPADRLGDQP